VSAVTLLLRFTVSMAVVIGAMWMAARFMRGRAGIPARRLGRSNPIEVIGRRSMTKSASVAVVRMGERVLVLGITDSQVSVLAEAQPGDVPELAIGEDGRTPSLGQASSGPPWKQLIDSLRERTVRRV